MTYETPAMHQPLGGRYQLGEVLGYGGMAEVYRGRDVRLGRDVAVKILRADLARDPSFQTRFRREAQAAASLNHPSIVSVFDTGDELGQTNELRLPYIVMEYVEGRTLREVLQAETRLQPRRALEVVAEVCTALEYAHRAGLVHRDIKPGNVMLLPDGAIKVMDFGIARAVTSMTSTMTQTAAVMGTAQYLSPEQARGEAVDARSDLYSTGCLLYELLTGSPPFRGDSPVAVAYQHVREDPALPSSLQPDLTPAIDAIVLKAMAKNPNNRYQSAAEFREDLLAAADGRPVQATPLLADLPTQAVPAVGAYRVVSDDDGEPRTRRRGVWALLLLLLVALIVGGALLLRSLVGDSNHGDVKTPNVIGMSVDQASASLHRVGLDVGKETFRYLKRNEKGPKGTVLEQNPAAPYLYPPGHGVDLVVSQGVQPVQIPGDLVNRSQTDVARRLQALGLDVGQVTTQDNVNANAGTVLATTPAPGTTVDQYTTVDLVVASGNIQLPSVLGQDYVAGTQALRQAGFAVRIVMQDDALHPAGTVVGQDPGGPGLFRRGTVITLTVAQTPAPPSPSPTLTPSASASPSDTPSPSSSPSPTPPTPTGTPTLLH